MKRMDLPDVGTSKLYSTVLYGIKFEIEIAEMSR